MTGKFLLEKKNQKKQRTSFYYDIKKNKTNKHDRLIFFLNNNIKLIYNDIRKFGFIKVVSTNKINSNRHIRILGPEPLGQLFNFEYFKKYIIKKKQVVKNLLMDQKFISGLGNI